MGWVTPIACCFKTYPMTGRCAGSKGKAFRCIVHLRTTPMDKRAIARGRLIACSHRERCLYRTEYDGRVTKLIDRHAGRRLNSPNDVVVKSDGSISGSPIHSMASRTTMKADGRRPNNRRAVYRFEPETGDIRIVAKISIVPMGSRFRATKLALRCRNRKPNRTNSAPVHSRF